MCCGGGPPDERARAAAAANADARATRHEYLFTPPKRLREPLLSCLSDARDAPILFLFINVAVITVPSAIALFMLRPSHLLGALHLAVNYGLFLQRFMLALHFSEHRRLFRRGDDRRPSPYSPHVSVLCVRVSLTASAGVGPLNTLGPYVLAPFFGVPCGMYNLHHCIMHHTVMFRSVCTVCACVPSWLRAFRRRPGHMCLDHPQEDNRAPFDVSSTEPFQRDNVLHFLWFAPDPAAPKCDLLAPIESCVSFIDELIHAAQKCGCAPGTGSAMRSAPGWTCRCTRGGGGGGDSWSRAW